MFLKEIQYFVEAETLLRLQCLAEAHSDLKVHVADPLDLLKNQQITQKHNVFLVSISGNTISNIKVAKQSRKSIAITSNPKSRLAKVCSRTIHLKFPNSDVFTGGSLSFLQSALTCISLVTNFVMPDSTKIFQKAIVEARKIKFNKKNFHFRKFTHISNSNVQCCKIL